MKPRGTLARAAIDIESVGAIEINAIIADSLSSWPAE